ncbi:hypothetical protein SDRG_15509 [Saprolegnia diclina VS20]|uniref:MalT-like TPR region domain-containing protein n=1 Tax=Saprolegnia diclina (strain VS20) TaxID=1156394 RepID=T0PWQ0_SAPDV|nr:hypothetical protein SDRG_15509 [Saprolegnia diclina VS20]EQC26671.1 hypothetical protein SDRG_15509 [Saprolegnia diclina VS20]|eukprot:XP_008619906.1 hypothetical protein SDRG_15509 [Saprolegnia diclina VS20]
MTPPTTKRGLHLSYLCHFINEHGGQAEFAGKSTAQVCFEFVVPLTKPSQLSLVDHVANDPSTAAYVAPANWYVSHAWQYLFLETVDSLERFFADRDLSDDAVLWFCVFNNNQHLASSYPFEYWSSTFKNGLAAIGNVVMIMHPWNDPIVLRRSWCVFEVYVAVTMGARFEIALAHDQEAAFLDDIGQHGAFHKMLATIKSAESETSVPSDRDGIFALIRAETSFIAVDRLIFTTLTSWIKSALEASIAVSSSSALARAKRWQQLGYIHDSLLEFAESERCFQEALRLFLETNGPVDADTLSLGSLVALAIAHQRKPRTEWEPRFRSTLAMASEHLRATHATTLAARTHLVISLIEQPAFADVLHLALEDFEWRRSQHGLSDARTAKTMSLAATIEETLLGRDHPATMLTFGRLVAVHLQMGDAAQGVPLAERITVTRERTLGATHRDTFENRFNMTSLTIMAGDVPSAMTQLLSLKTLVDACPHLRYALFVVYNNLGIVYAMQAQLDQALASYRSAFQEKFSAWALYAFAVHITPGSHDGVALARACVESTPDTEHETWLESCMVCYLPIIGGTVACAACPQDVFKFCTRCRDQRLSRLMRFCRHDLQETTWVMTVPLRRFVFEEVLRADDAALDDVGRLAGEYEVYCDTHKVPRSERLKRSAMPGLNRGWHPM